MRLSAFLLLFGILLTRGVSAQNAMHSWNAQGLEMTRAQLQDMLARYDAAASSQGYSSTVKARARTEAALIRARLQDGDFQVGDRIALSVQGHPELADTLTVSGDRTLILPQLGSMPLAGVLRSELQGVVTQFVASFIRDPDVQATTLIRISVMGAVRTPGFYVVPSQALLSEAIMTAGGPITGAKLSRMKIERGERVIWQGAPLVEGISEGRTLDQMSLRAGDQIVMPEPSGRGIGTTVLLFLPILPAIVLALGELGVI